MRRIWLVALALLLTGCGVRPSGVSEMGDAPTGVANGVTLYFVDANNRLQPQVRNTNRLGTIDEAMSLLLSGPRSDLSTQIKTDGPTRVTVATSPDLISLRVPLAAYEVTPIGIDQIVCTTLGVWVQSGGPRTTKVQIWFTLDTPESNKHRTCPLIT